MYKTVATSYTPLPVEVAPDFLARPPPAPLRMHLIDFGATVLPERAGCYAAVLDGVLTRDESRQLLAYAEQSSPTSVDGKPWTRALVNAGSNLEMLVPDYRNSERIIWDSQPLVDAIWARCCAAPGFLESLRDLEGAEKAKTMGPAAYKGQRWRFVRLNERMRFLRYEQGMFFREHCDGAYECPTTGQRSWYTLQLYLHDSQEGLVDEFNPLPDTPEDRPAVALSGGATPFYSNDLKRQIDVHPRAGRVLVFQHRTLLHAGADVEAGVKYTMRTDLMFERLEDGEAIPSEGAKEKKSTRRRIVNRLKGK